MVTFFPQGGVHSTFLLGRKLALELCVAPGADAHGVAVPHAWMGCTLALEVGEITKSSSDRIFVGTGGLLPLNFLNVHF